MRGQERWSFGNIEVLLRDYFVRASEIGQLNRIGRFSEFKVFLERWLGDPVARRSVVAIERAATVTGAAPMLGRTGDRMYDGAIVAGLQRAFEARRFHVFRLEGRLSKSLLSEQGTRWKLDNAQIILSNSVLRVGELAEYFLVEDAINFSKDIALWLRHRNYRETVHEIHKIIDPSSKAADNGDEESEKTIVKDLLTAWLDRKLYLLKWRLDGGSGGDDEPEIGKAAGETPVTGPRPSTTPKTWIEIVLLDDTDKPVPGVRYRLKVTDGSLREGTLGADGSVRVNGIDPGTCEIAFPDIDGREWHKA